MSEVNLSKIEKMIYVIRGQKVMLDADLAELYEVQTKRLNEQVRRNIDRFPEDFMFQLTSQEYESLKSQFATSKEGRGGKHKLPLVFTECGVAMLSSILNSSRAITVNISIMRTFVKLRGFLAMDNTLIERVSKLEKDSHKLFRVVFEELDNINDKISPKLSPNRKKIGFKAKQS